MINLDIMAFSISLMIVDTDSNVAALDWVYTNEDGSLSNQWKLQKPYGSTPLEEVTEEVAIGWLVEQLPNTAEEFDTAIAERKAAVEYASTLTAYDAHPSGPPTPTPTPPEELPAEEVVEESEVEVIE